MHYENGSETVESSSTPSSSGLDHQSASFYYYQHQYDGTPPVRHAKNSNGGLSGEAGGGVEHRRNSVEGKRMAEGVTGWMLEEVPLGEADEMGELELREVETTRTEPLPDPFEPIDMSPVSPASPATPIEGVVGESRKSAGSFVEAILEAAREVEAEEESETQPTGTSPLMPTTEAPMSTRESTGTGKEDPTEEKEKGSTEGDDEGKEAADAEARQPKKEENKKSVSMYGTDDSDSDESSNYDGDCDD